MPIGGMEAIQKIKFVYPENAKNKGIEGKGFYSSYLLMKQEMLLKQKL